MSQDTDSVPIDLDYFQWRERRNIDGVDRLLIPCSDPNLYERPADGTFATVAEAIDYLEACFEHEYDPGTWVLVHYRGIEVAPTEYKPPTGAS